MLLNSRDRASPQETWLMTGFPIPDTSILGDGFEAINKKSMVKVVLDGYVTLNNLSCPREAPQ